MLRIVCALMFLAQLLTAQESKPEMVAFDQIVDLMNKHYFDPGFHGVDWKKITAETRQKILAAKKPGAGYKHITNMLGQLKHSHLAFHPPFGLGSAPKKKQRRLPMGYAKDIDFGLEKVEGRWMITRVNKDSDAAKAGLKPGFEVVELNTFKTAELFEDEKLPGYNMERFLRHFPSSKLVLRGKNPAGDKAEITLKLKRFSGKYTGMGMMREAFTFREDILDGDIGYLAFNIFAVDPVEKAITTIKKMRDKGCKGIIIDLRYNPGGVGMMSSAIAKEFCSANYKLGTQTGREGTMVFPVFKQPKPFTGPLVILQNSHSASTSEVLAAGMQSKGTAIIIGETSAGMALPSLIVNLKDGSVFQYPVADFKTSTGKSVEGIGVIPDHKVTHTLKALRKGRDLYIDKAVEVIKSKTAK